MTEFLDGPAKGIKLMLRRAPHFLRAVKGQDWDALDQVGDRPKVSEQVVAYEMVGEPSFVHVRSRTGGGMYRGGQYKVVEPQPTDDVLRDQAQWEAWARAQFETRADTEDVRCADRI